jgi:hypothetical protein
MYLSLRSEEKISNGDGGFGGPARFLGGNALDEHAGLGVDVAQANGPDECGLVLRTHHMEAITGLDLTGHLDPVIDTTHKGTEQNVGDQDGKGGHERFDQEPGAVERADGGTAPERGGGIEAADTQALAENNAAAQKANAADHLAGDTRGVAVMHHDAG